jgi:hypothetical protein
MLLTKKEIQDIIEDEIIVDCYTEEEANTGWAIYMEENINYPFEAEYLTKTTAGEAQWKKITVVGSETDDSNFDGGEYFVEIELDNFVVAARLDELRNIQADEQTMKAMEVWKMRHEY